MIEITAATEKDFPTIQKIAHETWPPTFGSILSDSQMKYMLEMMYSSKSLLEQVNQKKHHFIIAWEDNKALGFVSYELNYDGMPITKIHKIYILPKAQGKGIGKSLIREIGNKAGKAGNTLLSLNVNRENPAVAVYEKLGFKIVNQEDIPIGNGFFMNDFVMEKSL